jgi:hypothetical protein
MSPAWGWACRSAGVKFSRAVVMYSVLRSAPPNAAEVTWLTGRRTTVSSVPSGV